MQSQRRCNHRGSAITEAVQSQRQCNHRGGAITEAVQSQRQFRDLFNVSGQWGVPSWNDALVVQRSSITLDPLDTVVVSQVPVPDLLEEVCGHFDLGESGLCYGWREEHLQVHVKL